MTEKILLQDILPLDKLKEKGSVLLIRHYHEDLKKIIELDLIEEYQSFQNKKAFRECQTIVSFIAEPNNQAKLYGVYTMKGINEKDNLPEYSEKLKPFCKALNRKTDFHMTLIKNTAFEKFENRIVIDWIIPRGWYNTYGKVIDKEIIKVLPRNFVSEIPELMEIKLSFRELKQIIENPDSHSKWYETLTRLQAVYLIMDNETGKQYIGTTYGKNGLWQRWESYVKGDFTGGNIKLIELKSKNPKFYQNFQYTILETLPKNATQKDCTKAESLWQKKLGTKTSGLN